MSRSTLRKAGPYLVALLALAAFATNCWLAYQLSQRPAAPAEKAPGWQRIRGPAESRTALHGVPTPGGLLVLAEGDGWGSLVLLPGAAPVTSAR